MEVLLPSSSPTERCFRPSIVNFQNMDAYSFVALLLYCNILIDVPQTRISPSHLLFGVNLTALLVARRGKHIVHTYYREFLQWWSDAKRPAQQWRGKCRFWTPETRKLPGAARNMHVHKQKQCITSCTEVKDCKFRSWGADRVGHTPIARRTFGRYSEQRVVSFALGVKYHPFKH